MNKNNCIKIISINILALEHCKQPKTASFDTVRRSEMAATAIRRLAMVASGVMTRELATFSRASAAPSTAQRDPILRTSLSYCRGFAVVAESRSTPEQSLIQMTGVIPVDQGSLVDIVVKVRH